MKNGGPRGPGEKSRSRAASPHHRVLMWRTRVVGYVEVKL